MPKKVRDDEESCDYEEAGLREAICLIKKAGSFKAAKKALEKAEKICNLFLSAGFLTIPPNHE